MMSKREFFVVCAQPSRLPALRRGVECRDGREDDGQGYVSDNVRQKFTGYERDAGVTREEFASEFPAKTLDRVNFAGGFIKPHTVLNFSAN
jgi:hypothetical protein